MGLAYTAMLWPRCTSTVLSLSRKPFSFTYRMGTSTVFSSGSGWGAGVRKVNTAAAGNGMPLLSMVIATAALLIS